MDKKEFEEMDDYYWENEDDEVISPEEARGLAEKVMEEVNEAAGGGDE